MSDAGAPAASAAAPPADPFARLLAQLAPTPGRWREATIVALGPTLALVVSVTLQLESFIALPIAYTCLQHMAVCSFRTLPRRLLIVAVAGIAVIPIGGVVFQLPWLFAPALVAAIAGTIYLFPMALRPVEGSSVLFIVAVTAYAAVFDPGSIATVARNTAVADAIGIVIATLVTQLLADARPHTRLAASLAGYFARNRQRFREALARYRAAAGTRLAGEVPAYSTLFAHLQLLDQVRQEGISHDRERLLLALMTASERVESYVSTLDALSRQDTGTTYRQLLDAEIEALGEAIERGLKAFEEEARAVGGDSPAPSPTPAAAGEAWPDFDALVHSLEARQLAVRQAGLLAGLRVAESTNANTAVRSLAGLADVLHVPPRGLAQIAEIEADEPVAARRNAWPRWPTIDPFRARYALQGGFATLLCLVVGAATHEPELGTIMFNPVLIAQSSYGATVRRAALRFAGVLLGALIGMVAIIAIMPNTDDVAVYVLAVFLVSLLCQYFALSVSGNWYGGFQTAITFYIVTFGIAPSTDVHAALWRAWGTILGTTLLFTVYRVIAPDYAGRQLVVRFRDVLRATLDFLPAPGVAARPIAEQVARRLEVGRAVGDLLRLADEARFESRQGVDATAAVDAVGLAMRLAYRAGLIARGRSMNADLQVAQPLADRLGEVERAARDWVDLVRSMLEARLTTARPGNRRHGRACDRAAQLLAQPRPDLGGSFARLVAHVEATHFAELADLPPKQSGEILAAIEHYRRIAELLPRLDRALARALLPGHPACIALDGDPGPPDGLGRLAA